MLNQAIRFFTNGVYLISAAYNGAENAMIAAWCAPVSFDPPMLSIHIAPGRHTHGLIDKSGQFAVNVLAEDQKEISEYVGGTSGANEDKFKSGLLRTFTPEKITAPLVRGCVANIECEVAEQRTAGDHTIFIGKVLAYSNSGKKPLTYHHGDYYALSKIKHGL